MENRLIAATISYLFASVFFFAHVYIYLHCSNKYKIYLKMIAIFFFLLCMYIHSSTDGGVTKKYFNKKSA